MAGNTVLTKRALRLGAALVLTGIIAGILVIALPRPAVAPVPETPDSQPPPAIVSEAPAEGYFHRVGMVPVQPDRLGNQLIFFFDEPLAIPAVGPDAAPLVTVDPPDNGVWEVNSNYLVYSRGSLGDGPIRVQLTEALRSASGKQLDPNERGYVLAPRPFVFNSLFSVEENDRKTVLGLGYNMPVRPEEVKQLISVRQGEGHAVPFTLTEGTNNQILRLEVDANLQWPITVVSLKGTKDASGAFSLAEDMTQSYPADASLSVNSVSWSYLLGETQALELRFSQDVDAADLPKFVSVTDAKTSELIPFTVTSEGHSQTHFLQTNIALAPGASTKVSVKVAEGLQGAGRSKLTTAMTTDVTGYLAPLAIENSWWNTEEREGLAYHFALSFPVELSELQKHLAVTPAIADLRVEKSYGNYFNIYGAYDSSTPYEFKLAPGMKYGENGVLQDELTFSDTSEQVPDYVGFGQDGKYYFPRRAGLTLDLESRNVEKATVSIHRLFPSNVAVALSSINDGKGGDEFIDSWSEQIDSKEFSVPLKRDRLVKTPLELDPLFPENKRGAFCLKAKAGDTWWSGSKIVLWTNIGVISHWQKDALVLFAHDLYSLAPIQQAQVTVYSTKNQVLGESATNDVGVVSFDSFDAQLGEPRVAVIVNGDDYTFLELNPRGDDNVAFTQDMPEYGRNKYDAFVYADRELYRPGEPVHLRWLVRTNYGDAVPSVPLVMDVIKPTGNVLVSQPTTLSALGGGEYTLQTEKTYPTGLYEVRLKVPGDDTPIGTYSFNVEEFVPARIKSTVELDGEFLVAGKDYSIRVNAQHLFGAPAADRKSEGRVVFSKTGNPFEAWKGYRFENDSEYMPDSVPIGEQVTDASGNAAYTFNYMAPKELSYPVQATVVGRVFELGGRAVVGRKNVTLFPSELSVGMIVNSRDGGGVNVDVAAVLPDGSASPATEVQVTLERQVWNYYVRRYYSDYEPRWSESFEPTETKTVVLSGGKGTTSFDVDGYGYYRVRVHAKDTPQYSTQSFYSYSGHCSLVDSARPSLIKVVLDKDRFAIGEEAVARIESPFDGQGIVVVQGERFHQMVPVTITDGVGIVRFPVTNEHFPNVWIEATVVHAISTEKTQLYPFSSSAMANVRVTDPQKALAIQFPTLPQEVLPHTDMTFEIQVADSAGMPVTSEITLAAVDEGIHLITDYQSPDPVSWVSRSRRPDYRRAHYYDRVAYDFDKPATGGDDDLSARVGAAEESWIKPLALWSGVVNTDATGKASVTFSVPEFTGQLRLVAVGATNVALGAQSANFYVRRPHMQKVSLPRFLLPSDTSESRVVLFNTTDTAVKAKVTWTTGGALVAGVNTQEIDVPAKGESNFAVKISARDAIGAGTLQWSTVFVDAAGAEVGRIAEDTPVPVYAPAAYESHHEVAILQPGASADFKNAVYVDDERTSVELSASANPLVRLDKALRYVVGYPYGCVEQTTSRLMPMYLLKQSEDLASGALGKTQNLSRFISSGISRLLSMQTGSGGLAYWPGGQTPNAYGSVYALHFLTLVKLGKDFDLPEQSFQSLQEYVRRNAMPNQQTDVLVDDYTKAYSLYVLALDGDLKAIEQVSSFDNETISRPARLFLAAALATSTGDRDRVKQYLVDAPTVPYIDNVNDGTFGSMMRNKAVELLLLQQIGGEPQETTALANELVAYLETRYYGNTHESAFIISALSGYIVGLKGDQTKAHAKIMEQDKEVVLEGGSYYFGELLGPGRVFKVTNDGQTPLYVNLTVRGVPLKPDTEAISEGLSVERVILSQNGDAVPAGPFRQGDSFVVRLRLKSDVDRSNVIVSDLLPAGLEIENSRLDPQASPSLPAENVYEPSYRDIRDDRLIVAFDELPRGEHDFYYIVRAVTPGTYQHPSAFAECMYDQTVRGRTALGAVEIVK